MNEILCGGFLMPLAKYSETCVESLLLRRTTNDQHSFRRMRRASHEALNKTCVTEFHALHAKEAVRLIDGILQNPNKLDVEFRRWV